MKKLLFIISLCLSLCACGQSKIQDTFFGCKYGSSMAQVKKTLSKEGLVVHENHNGLDVYDVSFGGYKFRKTSFSFVQNNFFHVCFSDNFKSFASAVFMLNSIKVGLAEKYAEYGSLHDMSSEDKYMYYIFEEDNNISVSMNKDRVESKDGELFFYVELAYYNSKLADLYMKQTNDEL